MMEVNGEMKEEFNVEISELIEVLLREAQQQNLDELSMTIKKKYFHFWK